MQRIDSNGRLTVYRLCRRFPPRYPDDYIPAANRRSFTLQSEEVQRASQGLSAYSTVAAVTSNAERFPQLGTIIVRYLIPVTPGLDVVHLVGPVTHLTVLGDFPILHECLDNSWSIQVARMDE